MRDSHRHSTRKVCQTDPGVPPLNEPEYGKHPTEGKNQGGGTTTKVPGRGWRVEGFFDEHEVKNGVPDDVDPLVGFPGQYHVGDSTWVSCVRDVRDTCIGVRLN